MNNYGQFTKHNKYTSGCQTSWSCDLFTLLEITTFVISERQIFKSLPIIKKNYLHVYTVFIKETTFPKPNNNLLDEKWYCFTFFKCQICICLLSLVTIQYILPLDQQ